MLDIPSIQKINLKLSAWLMSKVDPIMRAIVVTRKKVLPFSPADVSKVFGIPCGNRDVRGPDGNINEESISFIKMTLGMDQFSYKEHNRESNKLEKDCFQIAFIIFVMGHVLAPSSKHDYNTIDFWGALASTEEIFQFNWCEYVLYHSHPATCSRLPNASTDNSPTIATGAASHALPPRQPSALDYSNYIANRYPLMQLAVLLREQNARAILHLTTARQNIQNDMVSFTDKLMSALASACTCCAARGLPDCPLKPRPAMADEHSASANTKRKPPLGSLTPTGETSYKTPKARKLPGVRLDISDCEASCIAEAVKDLYCSSPRENQTSICFGISTGPTPKRKYTSSRSYASNPWFTGKPVVPPKTQTGELLSTYLPSLPDNQLNFMYLMRNWILHAIPRLVKVTGHEIIQQLVRNGMIDHELGSILIRRQSQLDADSSMGTPHLTHSHLLECDFSVSIPQHSTLCTHSTYQ
ncbi:hypothetical protein VPH35_022490 [Triticum aestivum]